MVRQIALGRGESLERVLNSDALQKLRANLSEPEPKLRERLQRISPVLLFSRTALRLCVLASIPRTVRGLVLMFLSLAIVIEFLKAALRCGDAICLILVEKARFVQAVFDGHRPLFSGPGILQFYRAILAWSETYSSHATARPTPENRKRPREDFTALGCLSPAVLP